MYKGKTRQTTLYIPSEIYERILNVSGMAGRFINVALAKYIRAIQLGEIPTETLARLQGNERHDTSRHRLCVRIMIHSRSVLELHHLNMNATAIEACKVELRRLNA